MSRKVYNEVYFSFEGWYWHIEDDIRDAWDRRFGEEIVNSTLNNLREWLKKKPDFEETIEKRYSGNWVYFLWECFERNENWRKENDNGKLYEDVRGGRGDTERMEAEMW